MDHQRSSKYLRILENHCDHFGEQVKAGQGDSGERQRPPLLPGDRAGDGWLRVERKGI